MGSSSRLGFSPRAAAASLHVGPTAPFVPVLPLWGLCMRCQQRVRGAGGQRAVPGFGKPRLVNAPGHCACTPTSTALRFIVTCAVRCGAVVPKQKHEHRQRPSLLWLCTKWEKHGGRMAASRYFWRGGTGVSECKHFRACLCACQWLLAAS